MTVTQCSRKTGSSSKVILALKFSKLACNDFHPARQIAMQILPRVTQVRRFLMAPYSVCALAHQETEP
uniref:Uncharacterized protein n=1 Tax=Vespula pensylvanica TaxID=30213 RepID=A0A834K0C3_VESPE|nr:hypothetical protein H0235_016388 [Vespula pensylvanica]